MSHRYGIFSWWWAHICPKHVGKSNQHIKKTCAPSWFYLQNKQARQCITWHSGAFVQSLLLWKRNTQYAFWAWVCNLMYQANKAHATYCRPAPLYNIFPHYFINGTIFGKKVTEHKMCVLIFSTVLSGKFLTVRRIEWDMIKMHIGLHVQYRSLLSGFNATWIFIDGFSKHNQNIKFHENPSIVSWAAP
jgi:hypothetical protein